MAKHVVRCLLAFIASVLVLFGGNFARAQGAGTTFDHTTTGFVLDGSHVRERCESCHIQGSFKGTPRDCATCHRPGGRAPGKPPTHVQTSVGCESCHATTAWTPANFRHKADQGVMQGACSNCHNGVAAPSKPLTHPVTSASCDSCHKTSSWLPAGYTHALVTAGTCATCHNGTRATGKPASHVPTNASCDACHTAGIAFSPATMNHSGTAGQCATCHSGGFVAVNALAKPATHIATTQSCDVCHGTTAWKPTTFAHTGVGAGTCATCHNGTSALGKSAAHIPTSAACDACHAIGGSFVPVSVGMSTMHSNMAGPIATGNCSTCHSGAYLAVNAQVKPATHLPTSAQCDTCHTSRSTWATGTFTHTNVAKGSCATCHDGVTALGKPTTHIPTNQPCDNCHNNFTAFRPAVMDHTGTAGQCATCHSGVYAFANALGKPTTHIPTTAPCDTCHTNFTAFKPAQMNHAATAGNCNTCHSGGYTALNAQAKPASHIPTTAQCDTCHSNGFISWSPATMNHAGLAGKCITCHSGGFISQNAQTKPATHIATTAQCDTCHNSTTTWATGTFNHATANPPVAGRCSNCHNNTSAIGKPVTHIPTGAQCDTCHGNFTSFKPATMNHTGLAGQCSTCHNGSYVFANALARPINHIPTSAQCDSCHVSGFVAWSPATMNHAGLAGLCSSCHNGTYLAQNAQTKPATHISTTAQCDTCHRSTTTWATATYTHQAADVHVCSTCHNGIGAIGKPTNHIPTAAQSDACHTNYSAFKPARMSHTDTIGPVAAGNCVSCHNGAFLFVNALGRPANHIPSTASCDTCHISGYTAWNPASMNHSGLAGACANCHNGAYLAQNAQTKPATHIVTTAQCDTCHNSTTTWATGVFNHATASPPVAGRCSSCHNGTNALGKPTNHIPTTAQCDTCHTNFTAFAPATMSHSGTTGPVAAGNCSSCHSGAYAFANAQAKPVTHLTTSAQCDTCHRSTTTWAGASYTHDAGAVGTCSTCHNGSTALGKNATHIPTSSQCDTCHTNYVAFKPAAMNHSGLAGTCTTCHNGSYTAANALAKPATHIPTGAQCDTCHINGFTSFAPATMNHAGTNSPVAAGNCATCHSGAYLAQNAQVKPATHIVTSAQCDTCHNSTTTWATGTFNHATANPPVAGRCSTCHNGTSALGKPTTHIPTTAQCDTCHTTFTAFAPAVMSHAGTTGPVAAGNCATCHGGAYVTVNAQAKPATHIATTQSCDVCHGTVAWKPTTFAHTGVAAGTCATCHNGTNALGKAASHIPTTASCDVCHTNYTAFAPATMNHGATTGPTAANNCSTCHSGTYLAINAQVKPATHVATTAQCDTCHRSTTTWATATFVHDATAVGNCATCHNGTTALGKPTTHIPTTAQCSVCHTNYTSFRPAVMSHAGTTGPLAVGNCSTCHNGSYTAVNALAKPATHIPTTRQCDSCHLSGYTAWSPATMSHTGLAGQCSTCHSGAYVSQNAQTKPATHIVTTAQCDTCHNSTTTWATGVFNHATASPPVAGRCSSCHNGTNALGKPTNHIPTTAQCDTCHTNFTAFAPATMSHSGTTGPVAAGNCISCHGGAFVAANALAKPATHIPTSQSCDVCHNTTVWKPTTFAHTGVAPGTCNTCHNGVNAMGKPVVHIPTTRPCDDCHRMGVSWLPVITPYAHTGVVAGSCATCHVSTYPSIDVKPASHLPTPAACDACHHSYVAWLPTTYNHAGIATGTCQNCHGGAYTGIMIKPSNHIPTVTPAGMPGNECSLCHSSKVSFTTERMNHGTVQTLCATCHDSTAPYAGNMQKINRSRHHSAGAKDCSSSGCHKPLGSLGRPYSAWN